MEQYTPPGWPLKAIRWLVKPDYLEELEGDLEEVFLDDVESVGLKKARRRYLMETIKMIRPNLIGNNQWLDRFNMIMMLRNNIKIALRVFSRDKIYTGINTLGLASGLAIALLIIQYVRFEMSYERFNPLSDRVSRITMDYMNGEDVADQDAETYPPLGPRIVRDINEAEDFARAYHISSVTAFIEAERYRLKNVYGADAAFFKIMGYPLIAGDPATVFKSPHEAALTESLAKTLFGTTDVLGKTFKISESDIPMKVTAVIQDAPANTHLKFEMLISFPSMEAIYNAKEDTWNQNNMFTYILLQDAGQHDRFAARLVALNQTLQDEEHLRDEMVISQPIQDIHLYSDKSFEPEPNGDATSVFFLLGVAILVILIALVNYINLSTSKSLDRAKEVGIRKVMGSSVSALRGQFFTESFLINLFAVVIAVMIMLFAKDAFVHLADLPQSFSFLGDPVFWITLVSLFIISALVAGIFPALVLSRFAPISVMKGSFAKSGGGALMRKGLVIFQFAITGFLLVQTLAASEQIRFMRSVDLGFSKDQTIVIEIPDSGDSLKTNTLKSKLIRHAQVVNATISSCVPGLPSHEMGTTTGIMPVDATEDYTFNFYLYFMDEHFAPTMDFMILAGENYTDRKSDSRKVLVNEQSLRLWGIPSPEQAVGVKLRFWGEEFTIKGVVKDFYQVSAKSEHLAMIMLYNSRSSDYLSVKMTGDDPLKQVEAVESTYAEIFPDEPFDFFFLDERYDQQFRSDEQFQQVFSTLTTLAILIACLGLFGLSSFSIAKRVKEIGIRKVLGASVAQLVQLISLDFMKLIAVAMAISLPITYFLIERWLENYATKIELSWWLFALPTLLVLLLSFFTVFFKTYKVSLANPSGALRDE